MALAKWKGFNEKTWEPAAKLEETAALDVYEDRYGPITDNDGALNEHSGKGSAGSRKGFLPSDSAKLQDAKFYYRNEGIERF